MLSFPCRALAFFSHGRVTGLSGFIIVLRRGERRVANPPRGRGVVPTIDRFWELFLTEPTLARGANLPP
jgi:hypothetical protein